MSFFMRSGIISLLVLLLQPINIQAGEFVPRAGMSLEHHTDIAGEGDDTVFRPYAGIEYNEQSANVNAVVDASVSTEKYLGNTFGTETFFDIQSYIDWIILPNRFSWSVEDYANSQRIDIYAPDTPNNLQTLNVFMTGPDLLMSNSTFDSVLKLRVGDVYYSESDADNSRVIARAFTKRYLNNYSNLGVDVGFSGVSFDADTRTDYDISSVVATYERELPDGDLILRAGYNQARFDGGSDESAPMGELALDMNPGGGVHVIMARLSQKYSDPAIDAYDPLASRLLDVAGQNLDANNITAVDVYELQRARLQHNYQGSRLFTSIAGFIRSRDYLSNDDNNTDEAGYSVGLGYLLSDRISVWGNVSQTDVDYVNNAEGLNVNTANYGAGVRYQLSDTVTVGAGYTSTSYTSKEKITDNTVLDYTDDVVSVGVQYQGASKLDLGEY